MPDLSPTDIQRIVDLRNGGSSIRSIARDPQLFQKLEAIWPNESRRNIAVWELVKQLEPPKPERTPYLDQLESYEEYIGAPTKRTEPGKRSIRGRQETIVVSDLHIPDDRRDLVLDICRKHAGANLVIAGDVNDFESQGRFLHVNWTAESLQQELAQKDAVLDILTRHFPSVHLIFGNHDLRPLRNASRLGGADAAWVTYQFLSYAYQQRHGVTVATHDIQKINGRPIPALHYWDQIGDCVIGHVEVAGKPIARSSERAAQFYTAWKEVLGLKDFRVVLQGHSHRRSYYYDSHLKLHCFEIGALCDTPDYAMRDHCYLPPQHGYYHLIQYDGVTDINESRLISLDPY